MVDAAHRDRGRRHRRRDPGAARRASGFGVIETDAERPGHQGVPREAGRPAGLPGRPGRRRTRRWATTSSPPTCWSRRCKVDAGDEGSVHDMGGNIIPMMTKQGAAKVYDFDRNDVPGATERDRGYWRDVGTLDAYYDAHMDLVSVHPIFNLYNRQWPILTQMPPLPPAKFVEGGVGARVDRRRRHDHLRRPRRPLGGVARTCGSGTARTSSDSVLMPGVVDRPRRGGAPRDPGQERASSPTVRTSASTTSATPSSTRLATAASWCSARTRAPPSSGCRRRPAARRPLRRTTAGGRGGAAASRRGAWRWRCSSSPAACRSSARIQTFWILLGLFAFNVGRPWRSYGGSCSTGCRSSASSCCTTSPAGSPTWFGRPIHVTEPLDLEKWLFHGVVPDAVAAAAALRRVADPLVRRHRRAGVRVALRRGVGVRRRALPAQPRAVGAVGAADPAAVVRRAADVHPLSGRAAVVRGERRADPRGGADRVARVRGRAPALRVGADLAGAGPVATTWPPCRRCTAPSPRC